jgi:hypothetical protein
MHKLFSPLGYAGAVVLILLGLSPQNTAVSIQNHLPTDVGAWLVSNQGRWSFVLVGFAMFLATAARRRRSVQPAVATYTADPLSLPRMTITEIAERLIDDTAWGWRQRQVLTLKTFVHDAVPDELRRVAKNGEVQFIGQRPNETNAFVINPGYWDAATFDGDRIWDKRNEFFTTTFGTNSQIGVYHLRHGRAPRKDVLAAWPNASVFLRFRVRIILWFRRARHGFPEALRERY